MKITNFVAPGRLALALTGLMIFVMWILVADPDVVRTYLSNLGGVYGLILGISAVWMILKALAWRAAFAPVKVSTGRLLRMMPGREAFNETTFLLPISGETVASASVKEGPAAAAKGEAQIRDRAVRRAAVFAFSVIALIIGAAIETSLPGWFRVAVIVAALLGAAAAVRALAVKGTGPNVALYNLWFALRIPVGRSRAVRGGLEEMDRVIGRFFLQQRGAFSQALILSLLIQILIAVEIGIIGTALFPEAFTTGFTLLVAGLIPPVSALFAPIPGRFGILEGLFAGVGYLAAGPLGLASALSLQVARRLRSLFWILVGIGMVGNPLRALTGK